MAAGGGVRLSGGALLVLGAAAAQATFFVSQKALLRRYGSLAVTAWAMGLGAAMALPLAPGPRRPTCGAAPTSALLAVGFLALGASALGFLTWAYAVARVDVTAAASTLYAVPPVAALVGWVALGEVPSPLTAVGGAIALAGVAHHVARRGRADHAHDELGVVPHRQVAAVGQQHRPPARRRDQPGDAPAGRARPTPA